MGQNPEQEISSANSADNSDEKRWYLVGGLDTQKSVIVLTSIAILIVLAVSFYLFGYKTSQEGVESQQTGSESVDFISEIEQVSSNPLENVPDLNPVERTNPFSGTYKNPFE